MLKLALKVDSARSLIVSIIFITASGILNGLQSSDTKQTVNPASQGYVAVNGGKLFYQTFGDGTPILILHGGPGLDHTYLLPQMLQLSQKNAVTFYDQRGSGKSLGFTLDNQTINIANFVVDVDSVRQQLGVDKIIIAGHSWGGFLAMNYALKYPEHVKALILMDSAPVNSQQMEVFTNEYNKRIKPLAAKLEKIQNTTAFKNSEPAAVAEFFRTIFSVYFYKPAEAQQLTLEFTNESAKSGRKVTELLHGFFTDKYDLTPQLQQLKIPTLIIHGENDIVPLSTAKVTQQAIPNSQLVVVTESDHFPYIEQPKQFFAAINYFVESVK